MKFNFITDSTSDISKEYAQNNDINVLPIGIVFDGELFSEGVDITNEEFYNRLKTSQKLPQTNQINEYAFTEAIKSRAGQGYHHCIFTISKHLSNTYESAVNAAKQFPDEKIYICDTNTTTVGLALLLDIAIDFSKKPNIDFEQFIKEIDEIKEKITTFGMIVDLKYLKMGGRLSAGAAIIGSILKITPIVILDGKVKIFAKHTGKGKSFNHLAKLASQRNRMYPLFIADAYCQEELNSLLIKEAELFDLDGNQKFFRVGAAIGTHAGPGSIVIAFVKE